LIKTIMLAHRKPGMTPEDFNHYWKDVHAPLAARMIPGMKKYVQNHLISLPGREYEGDGIVEMWWDDLDAHQKFNTWIMTEAGRELHEDGDRFCDISQSKLWLVEEHIIKE
jgi:uncharacterized protein (TIGR02118 family)